MLSNLKVMWALTLIIFFMGCASTKQLSGSIEKHENARVKNIIASHPELIDKKDEYGRQPLWIALKKNNAQAVKILLEAGAESANNHYDFIGKRSGDVVDYFVSYKKQEIEAYYDSKINDFTADIKNNKNPFRVYDFLCLYKESYLFNQYLPAQLARINSILEKHYRKVVIIGKVAEIEDKDYPQESRSYVNIEFDQTLNFYSKESESYYSLQRLINREWSSKAASSEKITKNTSNVRIYGLMPKVMENGYYIIEDTIFSPKKIKNIPLKKLYIFKTFASLLPFLDVSVSYSIITPASKGSVTLSEPLSNPAAQYLKIYMYPVSIKQITITDLLKNRPDLVNIDPNYLILEYDEILESYHRTN